MHAQAETVADDEGRALLHWLADGAMTLLGYEVERPGEKPSERPRHHAPLRRSDRRGRLRRRDPLFRAGRPGAADGQGRSALAGAPPRAARSRSSCRCASNGKITGIGVHAGLWTSQALTVPIEEVPRAAPPARGARGRSSASIRSGHSGKALRHALSSLPRDLLVNLRPAEVKHLAATAITLADRPRPTLILVRSILKGHMFAFVWLPRDELTTRRRISIGEMIEEAAKGRITNWSVDLGDGDLALVRYTLNVDAKTPTPDVAALDQRLDAMVRGWEPHVEEALGALVGAARATRLAMTYLDRLPARPIASAPGRGRRARTSSASTGSRTTGRARRARSTGWRSIPRTSCRLKIYRMGGWCRCPTPCRCSRISASACSRRRRPRLDGGERRAISTNSS